MKLICLRVCSGAVRQRCGGDSNAPTAPSANVPFSTVDLRVGTGAEATTGRTVTVNYTGWLYNAAAIDNKGTRFDAGHVLVHGRQQSVIPGFSQGTSVCESAACAASIDSAEPGYGAQGSGTGIPAQRDADLRDRAARFSSPSCQR